MTDQPNICFYLQNILQLYRKGSSFVVCLYYTTFNISFLLKIFECILCQGNLITPYFIFNLLKSNLHNSLPYILLNSQIIVSKHVRFIIF